MKPNRQKVSVIIPTIGRDTLDQCLQAIKRQTRCPDEVIVIHDTEKRGSAYARNQGIAQSSGDLLAFTDDDCVPPNDWLENMIQIIEQYTADVVGGTMRETDPLLNAIRMRCPFPEKTQMDRTGTVGNTANIIYKRAVLEKCLQHDGCVFQNMGEDIELIWRLQQRGAIIVYTPNPVIHLRKVYYGSYLQRQFIRGIVVANLFTTYHQLSGEFVAQPSLLWGQGKTKRGADWLKAIWLKIIGPFDVGSFQSNKDFLIFWLGEKIQGLGFIWGILVKHRN
ncbi:MAG: glycosyltransferase family 2 protein [Anaerolineaceae bacterium]|nr:MAG: glycosyltransferase family 2 protein [Anaerolineaceae bacterium]